MENTDWFALPFTDDTDPSLMPLPVGGAVTANARAGAGRGTSVADAGATADFGLDPAADPPQSSVPDRPTPSNVGRSSANASPGENHVDQCRCR